MEENKEQVKPQSRGRITDGFLFRQYVGSGNAVLDGHTIEFSLNIGASSNAPIVGFGNKFFVLDWDDIIEMAEEAGLFKDEVTA